MLDRRRNDILIIFDPLRLIANNCTEFCASTQSLNCFLSGGDSVRNLWNSSGREEAHSEASLRQAASKYEQRHNSTQTVLNCNIISGSLRHT